MDRSVLLFRAIILSIYVNKGFANVSCDDNEEWHIYQLDEQFVQVCYEYNETKINIKPYFPKKIKTNISIFNPDYMLQNVTRLIMHFTIWPFTLPDSSQLEYIEMGEVTPSAVWGGCSRLTEAYLWAMNYTLMPLSLWLANCTNLRILHLHDILFSEIPSVFDQAQQIEELDLEWVEGVDSIMETPLFTFERLHQYNSIKRVKFHTVSTQNYSEVQASLIWQLALLPELEELKLFNINFCPSGKFSPASFGKLKELSIEIGVREYPYDRLCFHQLRDAPLLQDVYIRSFAKFTELQLTELLSAAAPNLYLKYKLSYDTRMLFSRPDLIALINRPQNRTVTLNRLFEPLFINCDCDTLYWYTIAVKEQLLKIENEEEIMCNNDQPPLYPNTCKRPICERMNWRAPCVICVNAENSLDFDCQDGNLSALPSDVLNFNELTSSITTDNILSHLRPHNLSLTSLHLSNNRISSLTKFETEFMFAEPYRLIWLAGNPINCSCDNKFFLNTLKDHSNQIVDFKIITCDDNKKLSQVNLTEICMSSDLKAKYSLEREETKQRETIVITAVVLTAAAATVLLAVALNFRKQIRMFLFAHGWCLCCIREEELDADRHFDVFLSFCHADQDIVLNELLPTLDREYSVCIHLRDWLLGESIPMQIIASVEQSRRTIVFMSKAFLKSLWGILEFRTAYNCSSLEGRLRVIMIVLDDVLEGENLPKELRSYIRYNTYVRWDDPWLWQKLRYALPHRPVSSSNVPPNVPPRLHIEYPSASISQPLPRLCGGQMPEEQQIEIELQGVEVVQRECAIEQAEG